MFSLFLVNKLVLSLITTQESSSEAQLTCFLDDILKAKSFISCFESHEEALLYCVPQRSEAVAREISTQAAMIY